MASNNSSATGTVFLDTTSAQAALDRLNNKIKSYDDELKKANTSAARRLTIERDRASAAQKAADIQQQIERGLGATYNQQAALIKSLTAQTKNLAVGTDEYKQKLAELRKAQAVFDEMKAKIKGVDDAGSKLTGSGGGLSKIGVFLATFTAGIALKAFDAIREGIASVFSMRVELEKSVQNLSAITGATGKDLDFLKNAAIDLSKTSSQSAIDFVEGFKLIASAKPELLSAKEDLVAVTKQALLLAQASGLELPDAATRLTDALNQFGEPAQSAAKYVDALAAAAKFGAAEVPEVTEALLKFGSLAKASNINIYESAAAIELLAEKGLKGAEAGTQLRNVFLRLSAVQSLPKSALDALEKAGVNTQILQDKSLSLEVRLKELSKVQNNTNALVKIFGTENLNAGQIVLQNIPRYAELARQVKEQGVASEQAATNTDTLANKWQEFKNLLSSIFLEGSNSPLKIGIEILTTAVKGLQIVITTVVQSLQNAYSAAKLAAGVIKDLATLSPGKAYNRVKDSINGFDDAEQQKEDDKKRAEARRSAEALVNDAAKESLAEQRNWLEQNIELQNASFKAYDEMVRAGKKNTKEGKDITAQLYADTQKVNALRKLVKDGEASAAKAAPSNESTDTGNPAAEKKAAAAEKKAADDRKRLLEQYNEFVRSLNRSISDTLTPEASKKFAAIIRESADELEKLKKLAQGDEQYQKGKTLVLEKQRVAIHALVEEEAKLYKPAPEQVSTVDPSTVTGALKNSLPKTPVKVPIEIVPEIDVADEKAVTAAVTEVLDRLQRNAKAGFELDVLRAKNPGERRNALLAQLDEEHSLEMQNKALTDNEKLVKEAEYQQKRKEIILQHQAEIVAVLQQGLEFAAQTVDILGRFAQAQTEKENAQLKNELKSNDTKKAAFKRQLDGKLISQQEYNRQVSALDREAEAKKEDLAKKQFERNKKFQLAQAAISGAQAVLKTIEVFGIPFPPNFLGIGAMVLTLATIAAEVKAITAAKFAEGGKVDHPGNGKIRVASNIPIQPNGDDVLATVKRGEVILNEDQQRRLGGPGTFRAIGVPGFAGGGMIKPFWQTRPYRSIDYGRVTKSIQVLKYAEGGRVPLTPALSPRGEGGSQPDPAVFEALQQSNAVNSALIETITGLNQQLAAGIEANVSLKKIDGATDKRNRIKADSDFK